MNGLDGIDGSGGGGTIYNSNLDSSGGGGIGIFGEIGTGEGGKRLPGTKVAAGGKGGSGGEDAVDEHGGLYGGGGGGGSKPGKGARGVVRIIYTPDQSAKFPNTNVHDSYFEEKYINIGEVPTNCINLNLWDYSYNIRYIKKVHFLIYFYFYKLILKF